MANKLTSPLPPKELTPSERILQMAVEYIKLQSPATFAALVAARRLLFEVASNTLVPITKENLEEQLLIAGGYKRKLELLGGAELPSSSILSIAEKIDVLADKMREEAEARVRWRKRRQARRVLEQAINQVESKLAINSGKVISPGFASLLREHQETLMPFLEGRFVGSRPDALAMMYVALSDLELVPKKGTDVTDKQIAQMIDNYLRLLVAAEVEKAVAPLRAEIKKLRADNVVWVDQQEAEAITGRSYAWFYKHRTQDTLPITLMPRTDGDRRLRYSKEDCLRYARENRILPPLGVAA